MIFTYDVQMESSNEDPLTADIDFPLAIVIFLEVGLYISLANTLFQR